MKKNIISIVIGCVTGVIFGITALAHQEPTPVYATIEPVAESTVTDDLAELREPRHITQAERYLLAAVVYAEANTESLLGKQMVVDVVLNRVDDPKFPNCIAQVIYQPYQFWTAGMPTDYDSIPNDIYLAIDLELQHQTDTNVLYFRAGRYHEFGTPIAHIGNHFFSGR